MKQFLTLLLLILNSMPARALDNFFENDSSHFIKVDLITLNKSSFTLLSNCTVQADRKHAECKELAMVNSQKFEELRKCASLMMAGHGALGTASAVASVGIVVGSVMSGGQMAELGGLLVIMTGAFAIREALKVNEYYDDYGIYSEENQKDQDWTMSRMDYSEFMEHLSTSAGCSSEVQRLPLRRAPFLIELSPSQIAALSQN